MDTERKGWIFFSIVSLLDGLVGIGFSFFIENLIFIIGGIIFTILGLSLLLVSILKQELPKSRIEIPWNRYLMSGIGIIFIGLFPLLLGVLNFGISSDDLPGLLYISCVTWSFGIVSIYWAINERKNPDQTV